MVFGEFDAEVVAFLEVDFGIVVHLGGARAKIPMVMDVA